MRMPNLRAEGVWVRVAGHVTNIKNSADYRWRCFIHTEPPEINLITWNVSGETSPANMVVGTNPHGEENGLFAWIDFYGDIHIDGNDVLHITVRHPVTEAPAN